MGGQQPLGEGNDVVGRAHGLRQAVHRIGQGQQDHGGQRAFNAVGQGVHDLLKGDALEHHAHRHKDDHQQEGLHGLGGLIDHISTHRHRHDHQNGQKEVEEHPGLEAWVGLHAGQLLAHQGLCTISQHLAGLHGPLLRPLHGTIVLHDAGADQPHQDHREDGIKVEGNGPQEQGGAFLLGGDATHPHRQTAEIGCPASDGDQHAHRRGGGVGDVGQLLPGDPGLVRDAAHGAAHKQGAEGVAEINEHPQHPGRQLGPSAAEVLVMDPLGETLDGAGLLEIGHQDADEGVQQHDPGEAGIAQILLQQRGEAQQKGLQQVRTLGQAGQGRAGDTGDGQGHNGVLGRKGQYDRQDCGDHRDEPQACQFFHKCLLSFVQDARAESHTQRSARAGGVTASPAPGADSCPSG